MRATADDGTAMLGTMATLALPFARSEALVSFYVETAAGPSDTVAAPRRPTPPDPPPPRA